MAIIIILFLFGLFYNGESFNKNLQGNYSSQAINGTFVESGTQKSLSTSGNEYNFSINETQGILAIVIAVSVIGSIIGIRVLGSGLSEMTVKILYNTIFFYGVWGLFSVFSLELLSLIPVGIGWIIYFILTCMLSFGIVQQINSSSGINV
jgi:hypothetical protein